MLNADTLKPNTKVIDKKFRSKWSEALPDMIEMIKAGASTKTSQPVTGE